MKQITYRAGYKYQLVATFTHSVCGMEHGEADGFFHSLSRSGLLTISPGYAWDGPSGPAFDTLSFMRGSLVHDALYQMMREGQIPFTEMNRLAADRLLRELCREDGMGRLRAWWVFWAVRWFARPAADPSAKRGARNAP